MGKSGAPVFKHLVEARPCRGVLRKLSLVLTLTPEQKDSEYHLTDEETKSQGPHPQSLHECVRAHTHVTDKATAALTRAMNHSRSACPQGSLLPRKDSFSMTVWN